MMPPKKIFSTLGIPSVYVGMALLALYIVIGGDISSLVRNPLQFIQKNNLIRMFMKPELELMNETGIRIDQTEDYKGLGYSGQKKVAIDSRGDVFVAYRKKVNEKYLPFVARIKNEKGQLMVVDKPISVLKSEIKYNQRVPSITVDTHDNLHLVWYGSENSGQEDERQVWYSQSKDHGSTWTEPKQISRIPGYDGQALWQEHPDIAVTTQGTIMIVWEGKDSQNVNQQIRYSKSTDNGQTWSPEKAVNSAADNSQSRPSILADAQQQFHIIMYSTQQTKIQQIWYTKSDAAGNTFQPWVNISNSQNDSRHQSSSMSSSGHIITAWREVENDRAVIKYAIKTDENWSDPKTLFESDSNQVFPSVQATGSNLFRIAWFESKDNAKLPQDDPTNGTVYYATLKENAKGRQVSQLQISSAALYPNLSQGNTTSVTYMMYAMKQTSDQYGIYLLPIEN